MSGRQVIERTWDAPIGLVWELWTTAAGVASWYGPRGFAVDVHALDLRVGGAFHYTMRAADPQVAASMESRGRPTSWRVEAVFTEVDPPHRVTYDSPMGPMGTLTTRATFVEVPGGVRLTLVLEAFDADAVRGAAIGFESTLDRLGERIAASG